MENILPAVFQREISISDASDFLFRYLGSVSRVRESHLQGYGTFFRTLDLLSDDHRGVSLHTWFSSRRPSGRLLTHLVFVPTTVRKLPNTLSFRADDRQEGSQHTWFSSRRPSRRLLTYLVFVPTIVRKLPNTLSFRADDRREGSHHAWFSCRRPSEKCHARLVLPSFTCNYVSEFSRKINQYIFSFKNQYHVKN
jgi:hypothetical protein